MSRAWGLVVAAALWTCGDDDGPFAPPFEGTLWITPNVIDTRDPTSFLELRSKRQGMREMYDRRRGFARVDAHLFDATFGADCVVEVQVNPEFDSNSAQNLARRYATVLGRLPAFLLEDVETVWIHADDELWSGFDNALLIHTGWLRDDRYLEELLLHEATHAVLDPQVSNTPGWTEAQRLDPVAISDYAREFLDREDLAESLLPYLIIRFRADRITDRDRRRIEEAIPNRIAYLDRLGIDMTINGE